MTALTPKRIWLIIIIIILFFSLILTGLYVNRRQQSITSEKATGISNVRKEELTGQLVKNFPQIPVYPDAKLIRSYEKSENLKKGYEGLWQTTDNVSDVAKWYTEKLPASGWEIVEPSGNLNSDAEQFMIARKGNTDLYLTVENEDGEITSIFAEFPVK